MYASTKTFRTCRNNNPWFTAKYRQLRHAKEEAFGSRDRDQYKQANPFLLEYCALQLNPIFIQIGHWSFT